MKRVTGLTTASHGWQRMTMCSLVDGLPRHGPGDDHGDALAGTAEGKAAKLRGSRLRVRSSYFSLAFYCSCSPAGNCLTASTSITVEVPDGPGTST